MAFASAARAGWSVPRRRVGNNAQCPLSRPVRRSWKLLATRVDLSVAVPLPLEWKVTAGSMWDDKSLADLAPSKTDRSKRAHRRGHYRWPRKRERDGDDTRYACSEGEDIGLHQLLAKLEKKPPGKYRMRALNNWLTQRALARNWNSVWQCLNDMIEENVQPDVVTFTVLIDAMGRRGRIHDAVRFFRSMRRCGVEPNQISYNALITACARCQALDLARLFLAEMRSEGLEGNEVTFAIFVDCLVAAGQFREARSLLRTNSLASTTYAYTSLVSEYTRRGQIDNALDVFADMREIGIAPSTHTFTVLIRGLGTARRVDEAIALFDSLRENQPPLPLDTKVYDSILSACARGGRVTRAFQVFQSMYGKGLACHLTTYNSLIHACGQSENVSRAFVIYDFLSSTESTVKPARSTYIALANALLRNRTADHRTRYVLHQLQKLMEPGDRTVLSKTRALKRILWPSSKSKRIQHEFETAAGDLPSE